MTQEFTTLSDRINCICGLRITDNNEDNCINPTPDNIKIEDVKEFIRLLKEEIMKKSTGGRVRSGGNMIGHNKVIKIIDTLAGSKLVGGRE